MDPNTSLKSILTLLTCSPEHGGATLGADEVLEAVEDMLDWLASDGFRPEDETDWCDIIVACFWYCTHHHSGQWSWRYSMSCGLGQIYTPGCCAEGPEPGSVEQDYYNCLVSLDNDPLSEEVEWSAWWEVE